MVETRIVRRSASAGTHTDGQQAPRFPPDLTVQQLRDRNARLSREERMALVNGQLIDSIGTGPARARMHLLGEVVRSDTELVTAVGASGTTLDDLLGDAHRSRKPIGTSVVDQLAGLSIPEVVQGARALGRVLRTSRRPSVFGEAPVTEGVESRSPLAEGSF